MVTRPICVLMAFLLALGIAGPVVAGEEASVAAVGPAVALSGQAQMVSAGESHSCAVTTDGGVKCWGNNNSGQLGNGTTTSSTTIVDVVGLSGGVAAVSAGNTHTCALTTGGGVKCWGGNNSGQLGNGTTAGSTTPVDVVGLSGGVAAVSAGGDHTCALTAGGGVKCWGGNYSGQLGSGMAGSSTTPVDVVDLSGGVVAISAGYGHSCALAAGGGIKCWGANYYGQLGDGTTGSRWSPADVVGLSSDVIAVSAGGSHTCALIAGGGARCWGDNRYGQLGDGTFTSSSSPVAVAGLSSGVAAISTGTSPNHSHTCALTMGGQVKCWGNNYYGQLGDGTQTHASTPIGVAGISTPVSAISAGGGYQGSHTCALTTGGGVACWGHNGYGQLGDGTATNHNIAVDVVGLATGISAVSAGMWHTCALTLAAGARCWGSNGEGQLGDGTTTSSAAPVDVATLSGDVARVAAGFYHTCALSTGGGVKCWGYNGYGQLGEGTVEGRLAPVDVGGLSGGVAAVDAGFAHTCALTTGGGVKCWGYNRYGQLGDGTTEDRLSPVDVVGLSGGVAAVSVGSEHTCALTTGSGVRCWGAGGRLGDGTFSSSATPVDVVGLSSGATAVSAGAHHTCALTEGGGARCWGDNSYGALGDGTTSWATVPVDVVGLSSGTTAMTAGGGHTCALTAAGGAKCWGANWFGQLGDGTWASHRPAPVDVVGLTSGVAAVGAGQWHSCAVTTGGGVKCWGENLHGQLGIDPGWTPVDVLGLGGIVYRQTLHFPYMSVQ